MIHCLNLGGARNIVHLPRWRATIQGFIRSEFGKGVVISVEPELYQVQPINPRVRPVTDKGSKILF